MGMYDEIIFTCPKCKSAIIDQSKAGECSLTSFSSDSVPIGIASDILGDEVYCEKCDKTFVVVEKELLSIPITIPMRLREV